MLTSDLIKPYARSTSGKVVVALLSESDPTYLQAAEELIDCFKETVGKTRMVWWQTREEQEGTRTDYLRLRGLAKVLEDEATFSPLPAPYTPAELRHKLFARGPVFQEPDLFHVETRDDALREIAEELESPVEQVEAQVFADRPEEYLLTHPGPAWTPLSLLQRYNLELARGVLYRATLLRIEIYDNFKDVWRYLKLFKIMFWCEEIEGGYRLMLSGPMSDFVLTDRYGIAFAEFMPALLLGKRWRMVAGIKPFPEKIPLDGNHMTRESTEATLLRYTLDQDCGLRSHYRRAGQYDSQLERTFASEFTDFEEKFGNERGRWKLRREQEVLVLGGTVMIPDFQLVHSQDEQRKILIELVGYWSPTYLRNKVAKVRSANCPYLLLLVYEDLNVTRESFGDVSSEIVFFKQKPVIKEIMPVIEAMAERVYGPLTGTALPTHSLEQLVADALACKASLREEWVALSTLQDCFTQLDAAFSPRNYGCKDFSALLKAYPGFFELRRAPSKGRPLQVRLRSCQSTEEAEGTFN